MPEEVGLDEAAKNAIVEAIQQALDAHGVQALCPMCKNNRWSAEVTSLLSQQLPRGMFDMGSKIHVAVLTCSNCGFLSWHDLKTLKIDVLGVIAKAKANA